MKMTRFRIWAVCAFSLLLVKLATGQNNSKEFTGDSVDLQQIVTKVIETHPSVLKAEEAINSVDAGIGLARSAYYPDVDFGANYTRIGPVPAISVPDLGSFNMAPADNYNTAVNVRQTVYDFSKTKTNIQLAESNKDIAGKNIDMVKQRLSLVTITCYYTIAYLQEAVHIKEMQLGILEQHLDFVTRQKETGSATDYEILSTKVRISNANNQKLDLETAHNNQVVILNSLLGLPENTKIVVKNRLLIQPINYEFDSLISYAIVHRNEMVLAGLRQKQAELRLHSVKIENNPTLSAFASGGIKDGYFPELTKPTANYTAGLGLRVPIFTATRHKYNLQWATSDISSVKNDIEFYRREISSEVYQNATSLQASKRKIDQSELQLEQAHEALRLAALRYTSGTLTNLDLLDNESYEAESRLTLMKARIDYLINSARLEISIGNQGY
jgi:outer membrane protein TolC